jgi:hypothetical protein
MIPETMPAGTYYIGDLCYVLHERWEEFCDISFNSHERLDGKHQFKDGTEFVAFGTAYGDGAYLDNKGNEYGVDAGLIGAVKVDAIIDQGENNVSFGHIHTFDAPWEAYADDGVLHFGKIVIDTKGEEEDQEDEEDQEEYDDGYGEDDEDEWGEENEEND